VFSHCLPFIILTPLRHQYKCATFLLSCIIAFSCSPTSCPRLTPYFCTDWSLIASSITTVICESQQLSGTIERRYLWLRCARLSNAFSFFGCLCQCAWHFAFRIPLSPSLPLSLCLLSFVFVLGSLPYLVLTSTMVALVQVTIGAILCEDLILASIINLWVRHDENRARQCHGADVICFFRGT
jgi:hypothetical protein